MMILEMECSLTMAMMAALLSIAATPVVGAGQGDIADREGVQARNALDLPELDLRGVVSSIATDACTTHPCAEPTSISSGPVYVTTEHPKPSSSNEGAVRSLPSYSYSSASVLASITYQSSTKTEGVLSSSYGGYSYSSASITASVTAHSSPSHTHGVHNSSSSKSLPPSTSSDADGFINSILTLKPSTTTSTILFTAT
ncbi:hypothetical protein B0J14DRAFT_237697 [Halenospora varia]|nr:hypothetical protein B0J14DRAFT_237697 [Halenospora varia]